jgi:hypothetical protein
MCTHSYTYMYIRHILADQLVPETLKSVFMREAYIHTYVCTHINTHIYVYTPRFSDHLVPDTLKSVFMRDGSSLAELAQVSRNARGVHADTVYADEVSPTPCMLSMYVLGIAK